MNGGSVATALFEKGNPGGSPSSWIELSSTVRQATERLLADADWGSFLRIPPFPHAKASTLNVTSGPTADMAALAALLRRHRVGGTYWAAQPELPAEYVLVRDSKALAAVRRSSVSRIVLWAPADTPVAHDGVVPVSGDCDPWHMLAGASTVVANICDEVCVVAALLGVPVQLTDPSGELIPFQADVNSLLNISLAASYENPFTGLPMSAREAIELCGFWRELIDNNRGIAGGLGFAFWKQDYVAPLLWDGSPQPFRFMRDAREAPPGSTVALWRAKTPPEQVARLSNAHHSLVEVEDGFLRSQGLGADCVPPLSITVDRLGAHFDPAQPSELEYLLENGAFDEALLARSAQLRELIVVNSLSKYGQGGERIERPAADRRHILVPGQVEDDRAVQTGGCGLTSNLELVARVRTQAPDAYVLYKPHPDVLAGHRAGAVRREACLEHADEVVTDVSISSLIDMVDEVHVNTSLAGFEALMRGKAVTAYGVPFYAGWGLTTDLGPVPSRRTARRSIDELVAATLLIYSRYLDPLTGLPCPAETLVERLSRGVSGPPGLIVLMRRLQGCLLRTFRSVVQ